MISGSNVIHAWQRCANCVTPPTSSFIDDLYLTTCDLILQKSCGKITLLTYSIYPCKVNPNRALVSGISPPTSTYNKKRYRLIVRINFFRNYWCKHVEKIILNFYYRWRWIRFPAFYACESVCERVCLKCVCSCVSVSVRDCKKVTNHKLFLQLIKISYFTATICFYFFIIIIVCDL